MSNYKYTDQQNNDCDGFKDDIMPHFRPSTSRFSQRKERSVEDYDSNLGNVVFYTPKSYKDVQMMIDSLRLGQSIIVNFEGIANASAQRILDFLSGASYGLGGSMRRIKDLTFLITPSGTGITDNANTDID